jgi:hypothetical protein
MILAGNISSGVGIVLMLAGFGYWLWFILQANRIAVIRSESRWHLLGHLTIIGMLVFAAGRVLAKISR